MTNPGQSTTAGKKLCKAGFIFGIIGLVLFWIPWLGLVLAGIGLVFSIISFIVVYKGNGAKKLIIIALAISIAASGLSALRTYSVMKIIKGQNEAYENYRKEFQTELENVKNQQQQQNQQKPH
ncbi:MAG: hypothetical protein HY958_09430 [Bacteroidia bacterium]|nr:hypothetical protein [Bacteroidia bacterium]